MIQLFKEILSELEHYSETENEYVSETALYEFIVNKLDYRGIEESKGFYFKKLASAAIAKELIRQGDYGMPGFSSDHIFDLLVDRDEKEYLALYNYYVSNIDYLEYHQINGMYYFFSENLRIKYNDLLRIFALIISEELTVALEKVNKILLDKATLGEWDNLIFGGSGEMPEGVHKEYLESIVSGVLK